MRRIVFFICLVYTQLLSGQSIKVSAPENVNVGENFRLSYTVNTQDVEEFRAGNIPEGLEVIAGPYTSSRSSFQMVKGHVSSSSSITYTYTLYAAKNGTYTIPPAHAKIEGKSVASGIAKITVSGTPNNSNGRPQMHDEERDIKESGTPITGKDLFIKVSANKTHVHEQEPIMLTYKVYTLVDLTNLDGKMPDLTGFHTQEVKLPQQKSFHVEKLNGKNYRCVTWSQYVMYPQMTGKLEIPSITFKGIVVQQNRNVDPFEAFFNGGSGFVEVKKNIVAPGMTIQVDSLPNKPANFSGGVGKFNISAQLNHSEIKAGDPLSLRVVIGGNGNLKLIKQPEMSLPKDFDKYDPKITDKTSLTVNGIEGNMVYDYLLVPRNQGEYTIPPIEFVYYDVDANTYKTAKTSSLHVKVLRGNGRRDVVADYSIDHEDIRPIKSNSDIAYQPSEYFFGSSSYLVWLLVPFVSFVIVIFIFRKRALDNADVVKMKGKRANKVAVKRLRQANKFLEKNDQSHFYEEVMRALWGYVGDKLNMPVTQLSKENIMETLEGHGISEQVIRSFIAALDDCEFNQYAPGDPVGNMNKTYTSAIQAIVEIEDMMKKKRTHGYLKAKFILCLLVVSCISYGQTKMQGDSCYLKGNYQEAICIYEKLLKNGDNCDLYYNLGNAYFRTENLTKAILAYERAYKLSPTNQDVKYNLQYARSKTIDKVISKKELFFVTWYRAVLFACSTDSWAWLSIISIIISLVLILFFLFMEKAIMKKIGFYGTLVFLCVFLLSNLFAYQQKRLLTECDGAVVVMPSVSVKRTPDRHGADAFVIHEGTSVEITDKTMRGWYAIRLSDGREGWILVDTVEMI